MRLLPLLLLQCGQHSARTEIRERCLLGSKAGRAYLRAEEAQADREEEREEDREERDRARPASLEEAVRAAVNATWRYKEQHVKSREPTEEPRFPLPRWDWDEKCTARQELWACVGGEREWSVVFVDHLPLERRAEDIARLVAKAELVVVHDSQANHLGFPADYVYQRSSWDGRRTKTHISVSEGGQGEVYTTLIQGDLDKRGRFPLAIGFLRELWEELEALASLANPEGSVEGSHAKFLAAAVLATPGDVLELGTGMLSTGLLHSLLETEAREHNRDREAGWPRELHRSAVSVDSDSDWLARFHEFAEPWHQFVLLPVYSHGTACDAQERAAGQDHSSSLAVNVNFAVREATSMMAGELTCQDMY